MEQQPDFKKAKVNSKKIKESNNQKRKGKQPKFGICFDVDGVLARGTLAIPSAVKAMQLLSDEQGEMQFPVCYVTNALNRNQDKANQIAGWFDIQVSIDQMIQAPGPLKVFKNIMNKHCLVIGQGKLDDIAEDLGFTNYCYLEDIIKAYPLLDMVDHDNRKRVAKNGYLESDFPRVEAIILLGEPRRWESSLQLVVDILKTNGKPNKAPEAVPETHLPVIACNMDLQFMERACMPRYGHGAYLVCLEALYKKSTGHELQYTSLIGKPSEVTFRYAEHVLSQQAKKLGMDEPLERMYLIGDTPESDIIGANLYQRFIDRLRKRQNNIEDIDAACKNTDLFDPELPQSRNMPLTADLLPQTVDESQGILVCTGCYVPGVSPEKEGSEKSYKGHRDFPYNNELYKPKCIVNDVNDAVKYILESEQAL